MKILDVGCGAIGAYFMGRLAQHGAEVSVTVRSDYETIRCDGFQVQSIAGNFTFKPARVLHDASEYGDCADYLVLTSKVLPGADAVKLLQGAVHPGTVIVLIQNGIGIEDAVAAAFPDHEILSVVAYIGVSRTAPGMIVHSGAGRLILGRFGGGESAAGQNLSQAFSAAGVPAEYTAEITYYRWKKLLWNLPYNSISVLGGGLLTDEMVRGDEVEKLCIDLMGEICRVAAACGVHLDSGLIEQNIRYTREFPPYKTSMLLDYENHRPLEVEAIVGAVVKLARAHALTVPRIETLYALLDSVNRKRLTENRSQSDSAVSN